MQLDLTDNTSIAKRFIGNVQFDYALPWIEGLRANLNMGMDYQTADGENISDKHASWIEREPLSAMSEYTNTSKNSLLDFYLNYVRDLDFLDSKLDVTAGYSWQHFYYEGSSKNRSYEGYQRYNPPYKNELFLVSFFGRLNYSILDRYLITATLRDDGSSRFSKDNRWGLFPAFALAWKINNEAFLKDVSYIDELKLRLGYGITGQQDIGSFYPYIPTYQSSLDGAFYQFGDRFYTTLRPNPYDINIKWEETVTQNIGLDYSLWGNRVSGSLELYKRVTNDLLNNVRTASGTNFSNYLFTNVGSLENTGVEASIIVRPISTPDMSWEIGANFAHNKNKITKLTLVDDPNYVGFATGGISGGVGNTVMINNVGHAANTFLLFKQVYGKDGLPVEGLYIDKTKQGGEVAADDANKYYCGTPTPDFLMGFSSRFAYKNFDLAFSARLSIGNYVYNNNASNMALYQSLYNQSGYTANILADVSKSKFMTAQYWSDFYLEDGSFLKMDNITAGYNFDKLITEKLSGRISFTVQNAFTITKYSGLDPEVDNGIDNTIFPRPRTFVIGLNVQF